MMRAATLAALAVCLLVALAATALARTFRTHTTLAAPAVGSEISGELSSPNPKCLKHRKVHVDIEPFVASTTPRQLPVVTTDSSGAWHAAATLQDRYDVRVGVEAKVINFKRHAQCGPARAEQSVGPPDPPGISY
jgi:hypothetical protein